MEMGIQFRWELHSGLGFSPVTGRVCRGPKIKSQPLNNINPRVIIWRFRVISHIRVRTALPSHLKPERLIVSSRCHSSYLSQLRYNTTTLSSKRLVNKTCGVKSSDLPLQMGAPEANMTPQALPEMTSENIEALLDAARYDDMDDVKSLEASGVPLDSKDEQGRTALHMAAANGHIDLVEYLISRGVDLNSPNEEKNTPLHWACLNGHVEVVKKLIMAGANVSVLNSHERTPMDEAVSRGKLEVMDAINEAVAMIELRGAMVFAQET